MDQNALIQQRDQELANIYNPQVQLLEQQMQALPGQFAGQRSSLEQAKINAFRDIGTQAQRQGMFFSGFKPAEQGRYLGEKFLPGLQDLQAREEQSKMGLMGQITGLKGQQAEARMTFLERLRQEQAERQEQIRRENLAQQQREQDRQFEMQMQQRQAATSSGRAQVSVGDQIKLAEFNEKQPRMVLSGIGDTGSAKFAFTDRSGNPVSAARYAELTGQDIRGVLLQMGQQGDTYAQQVYNNLKQDPNPQQNLGKYKMTYSPLFWGT